MGKITILRDEWNQDRTGEIDEINRLLFARYIFIFYFFCFWLVYLKSDEQLVQVIRKEGKVIFTAFCCTHKHTGFYHTLPEWWWVERILWKKTTFNIELFYVICGFVEARVGNMKKRKHRMCSFFLPLASFLFYHSCNHIFSHASIHTIFPSKITHTQ